MKTYIFSALIIVSCLSSVIFLNSKEKDFSLVGTWVLRTGVLLGPDGQVDLKRKGSTKELKVISDTHFTTIWQNPLEPKDMGFNGGSYTFKNNIFTEQLEFFSFTERIGETVHYKIELEENTLSMSACDSVGNISKTGYFQVWERLHD